MSAKDTAAQKVKRMFSALGEAPRESEARGNLLTTGNPRGRPKGDPTVQLNLRVPPEIKKRVRLVAARDGLSLSEVVLRALELYEEKHGAAPKV